jgi:V/A-type H+-transporting ATPase subunit I
MVRLSVVVLERDKRAVLLELGRQGAMELVCVPAGADTAPMEPQGLEARIARCDRILARISELRRLLETGRQPPAEAAEYGAGLDAAERTLDDLERRAAAMLERRRTLLREAAELDAAAEESACYDGAGIPLDRDWQSGYLHFVMGTLPEGALPALRDATSGVATVLAMPPRGGRQPLVAIAPRAGGSAIQAALRNAGFRPAGLPAARGATTDTLVEELRRRRLLAATGIERLRTELAALAAGAAADLEALRAQTVFERRLIEAERNFPRTGSALLIGGWVPADAAPLLRKRIDAVTGGRCAAEAAPAAGTDADEAPVLLRQPRVLRPFAALVAAYGLPRHGELAPTVFVAVSYVVMFGMMFGDVGHGAVLAAAGLVALLSGRSAAVRDAGVLLLAAGASAAAFGALYGSYFGLPSLRPLALWLDPLEGNPERLMYSAIAAGVAMISLGVVLNIVNRLRRGDLLEGFLGKFGIIGIVFYWGVLLIALRHTELAARGLLGAAAALFVVVPVAGWISRHPIEHLRRRDRDGMVAVMAESLVDAFEAALSYFANTISFVRLAAYAMSHSAILLATFILASELERISGCRAFGFIVPVLGNAAAILLEGLVASVQALRLEYYEFFGKFFSGAGRPFRPFVLAVRP